MHRSRKNGMRMIPGLLGAALAASAGSANAQVSYLWTAGGDGISFGDALNWTPNGVPASLDEAKFDLAGSQSVSFALSPTVDMVSVENDTAAFSLNGNILTTRALVVGDRLADIGKLTVSGGSLTTGAGLARIGKTAPSTGTLIVTGGATMTNQAAIVVGDEGAGTLQIDAGGSVSSMVAFLADETGSSGAVTVQGTWNVQNGLLFGNSGAGTATISAGGDVAVANDFKVGDDLGSSGTVTVTGAGSTLSAGLLSNVGNFGPGQLHISSGGLVSVPGLRIADDAQGDVTVDGASSKLASTGAITVATRGVGSLTVSNGATVEAPSVTVNAGGTLGGSGAVTGSVANGGLVRPGNSTGVLSVGGFSQTLGTLEIEVGGANPGSGYDQLGVSGSATLGGTLTVSLVNGYNPGSGTYVIIQGGSVTGTFASVTLPADFTIAYEATRVVISKSSCVADFNGDGAVNTQDVIAFLNAWVARDPKADVNGDGAVNTQDVILFLNLWTAGC